MQSISVKQLADKQRNAEVDLIDVRTPLEYREVHAHGAKNIPLDVLDPSRIAAERNEQSDEPIYIICHTGGRSKKAVQKLLDAGIENVVNVEGGTLLWSQFGLPVERGKKAISLERQVRIAAGFLVLLGAVLGYFLHPGFIALSAFVGAGLMFAGITDTCGMGLVLARMPWNHTDSNLK